MTFEQLIDTVRNLGVPIAMLIWVCWRGDYFMRYFINKLDKFNDELDAINLSLRDLINQGRK